MPNGVTRGGHAAMNGKSIAQTIFADLVATLFDVPIMGNQHRPHYVERLVTLGLGRASR